MSPKYIAAALSLALGLIHAPAPLAAGTAPARSVPKAPPNEDLVARTVFQTLVGEFALQRGDPRLASDAWTDLAIRTRDPAVIARATEIAAFARLYDRAIELSGLWLEVEPESAKARQMQASLLTLSGRLDALAPQLATMLAQDPANLGNNLLHLNRLLSRITDKKALLELVDRLTAPYADRAEAHFALTQAAAAAGDEGRALAEIDRALQLRPDWEIAALARTQLQARLLGPSRAANQLGEFVDRNPGARDARLTLARLLIAEKRYDEARTHFERLLKDHPDNPEIIYPVAMLALQNGDATTGRQQLEHLLQTDFPDKSTVHFFLGQLDQEQKQPAAALAHYLQVSSGDQYIQARGRAAQILLAQDQPEAARQLLHETQTRTPAERSQLMLAEAQLLREAGRHNDAYITLATALETQPDNADLLYEAALTAERIGKPEILENHLKHLLELKPEHAHALNALGYSLADRNLRLDEAHALIRRALALSPDDPFITDSLGWVLYRQGRLPEALQALEAAYRLKADPEIAAHLGEVLWSLQRRDEARRILQEAAGRHPDNAVLNATRQKLQP